MVMTIEGGYGHEHQAERDQLLADMNAWATAADLARLYNVKRGTIHAWASQDHWRRKDTWPRRYSWEDAQASWERRHPGDWAHYGSRPGE